VQYTTKQLLLATFLVAVGLAACLIETREPYGILAASLAFAMAGMMLFGRFRSERRALVAWVAALLTLMVLIGAVFALLGR
jgi:hypothetical protein